MVGETRNVGDEVVDDECVLSGRRRGSRETGRREHRSEQRRGRFEVDVAARQDDADALAAHRQARVEHGGRGERARRLDHELHALPEKAHRLDDLGVAHGHDVVHVAKHQRKRDLSQRLRARAVGDGLGILDALELAAAKRARRVVARLGLHADHPDSRGKMGRRDGASREQPRAAAADEERVERADILEQLLRRGALAGDHGGVVEGRDQRRSALGRDALRRALAALARRAIVEDHFRPVRARGGDLHRGRIRRHHDHGGNPEEPPRERDRLRMVARREGDDAVLALVRSQRMQGVVGAAELEGARALEVLALEEDARSRALVDGARGQDGSAMGDPAEPLRGLWAGQERDDDAGSERSAEAQSSRSVAGGEAELVDDRENPRAGLRIDDPLVVQRARCGRDTHSRAPGYVPDVDRLLHYHPAAATGYMKPVPEVTTYCQGWKWRSRTSLPYPPPRRSA